MGKFAYSKNEASVDGFMDVWLNELCEVQWEEMECIEISDGKGGTHVVVKVTTRKNRHLFVSRFTVHVVPDAKNVGCADIEPPVLVSTDDPRIQEKFDIRQKGA